MCIYVLYSHHYVSGEDFGDKRHSCLTPPVVLNHLTVLDGCEKKSIT